MEEIESELDRFGAWCTKLRKAEDDWQKLLPSGPIISVLNGPSYLVAGINRATPLESRMPETPKEWRNLGWTVAHDGARSLHPRANRTSALAKAAKQLAAILRSPPEVSAETWLRLMKTGERLAEALDEQPDPATTSQRNELRFVDELAAETLGSLGADAHARAAALQALRDRDEKEERLARRIAELQANKGNQASNADEQRLRLAADTPWGRAILAHLLRQTNHAASTAQLLAVGIAEAETADTKGKKTVQNCMLALRRTCARQGGCPPCSEHLGLLDYPAGKTRGVMMLTQMGVRIAEAQKRGER